MVFSIQFCLRTWLMWKVYSPFFFAFPPKGILLIHFELFVICMVVIFGTNFYTCSVLGRILRANAKILTLYTLVLLSYWPYRVNYHFTRNLIIFSYITNVCSRKVIKLVVCKQPAFATLLFVITRLHWCLKKLKLW